MAPENPPELPKLPPIRESAEQALPPFPDDRVRSRAPTPSPSRAPLPPGRQPPTTPRNRRPRGAAARRARPRRRPPDDRSPYTADGRRLGTAGHGLIVAVLGLVFGSLLLAPGMHKAAFNGQPGAKRDVSLALTGALAHVSHALLLDRPRGLVQDAMGREDADKINVAIIVPPSTATPKPGDDTDDHPDEALDVAKPPAKRAFTPKKKLRLWIAGDSLVIVPGYSMSIAAPTRRRYSFSQVGLRKEPIEVPSGSPVMIAAIVVGSEVEDDDVRVESLDLRRQLLEPVEDVGARQPGRDVAVDASDRLDHGAGDRRANDRVAGHDHERVSRDPEAQLLLRRERPLGGRLRDVGLRRWSSVSSRASASRSTEGR